MKKMWKRSLGFLLAVLMLVFLVTACGSDTNGANGDSGSNTPSSDPAGGAAAGEPVKTVTLKVSHDNPATTPNGKRVHWWADSITAASNGTLDVVVYDSESLGKSSEGLTMMDSGIVDIQLCSSGTFPGKFDYLDAFCMPMMGFKRCAQGANAFWDIYEAYPQLFEEELKDYILLNFCVTPAGIIGSDRVIETPSDLKAMNLRCNITDLFTYLSQFGANPILMGASDIYTSFEKGVIDGYCFEWGGVATFSLDEITPYYLDMGLFVNNACFLMNRKVYDSLCDEAKAAIDQYSYREGSVYMAETYMQPEADEMVATVDPAKVLTPDEENLALFTEAAKGIWKEWGDKHPSDILDGNDYIALIREKAEQYSEG